MFISYNSDHGSVRCLRGVKVLGDKETTTCLRNKLWINRKGRRKTCNAIPDPLISSTNSVLCNNFIAKEIIIFLSKDYHFFVQRYRDSFQHGGLSMEEMIIPVVTLITKIINFYYVFFIYLYMENEYIDIE
jgi:hypothetical protein